MPDTTQAGTSLYDELLATMHELRGALTELLAPLGIDIDRPQTVAHALKLDKNLAWKVCRIIRSADAASAVPHLPGSAGFEIFLNAAKRTGASSDSIARARAAISAVEKMVSRHVGDRPTLELVLDSLPDRSHDRLIVSRKLAFRGNSGIWGVQAKTRLNAAFVAPAQDDPNMLDVANVGGWVDFRRLRADARWALFRVAVADTRQDQPTHPFLPIDPDESAKGPMLLRQFCSPTLPPIEAIPDTIGDLVYELGPSSVGNAGAFSCFFGSRIPHIGSKWADKQNDRGEFAATISAPVEALQFDLLLHRDCQFAANANVEVYGVLNLTPATRHPRDLIPLVVSRVEIGRFPPVVDTPRVPGYAQIIDDVMQRCGWNRSDFLGIRYTLEYPPYPSTVVIAFPLASRSQI
jgi:hypothetical protein